MTIRTRHVVLGLAVLGMAGGLALPAMAEGQESYRLRYDVYMGGSHMSVVDVAIDRSNGAYAFQVEAEVIGLFAALVEMKTQATAEGLDMPQGLQPQRYFTFSRFNGDDRTVDVLYENARVSDVVIDPEPEYDDRDPVSPSARADTIDPFTAVLAATDLAAQTGTCGTDQRIFDGRRLYTIQVNSSEATALPVSDYGIYGGDGLRCTIGVRREAGFWRAPPDRRGPEEFVVYLAPASPGGPMIPVRLEADTNWGAVRGHLVAVN